MEVATIALTKLYTPAMACDLTRVAVLGAVELGTQDIGAPSDIEVHQGIAHESGSEPATGWMTNYYSLHAQQFADLVAAFKAVPDPQGEGTMLDNSLLLWITTSTGCCNYSNCSTAMRSTR